tara:strand:+ start:287 stop:697 length:411 start_codon:yes stop_codon:yes gene_type:complete
MIGVAHFDGRFSDEEKRQLKIIFKNIKFSDDERAQIQQDILYPPDPIELYEQLKTKEDIYRCLIWMKQLNSSDGESVDEKALYDQFMQSGGAEIVREFAEKETFKNELNHLRRESSEAQKKARRAQRLAYFGLFFD